MGNTDVRRQKVGKINMYMHRRNHILLKRFMFMHDEMDHSAALRCTSVSENDTFTPVIDFWTCFNLFKPGKIE